MTDLEKYKLIERTCKYNAYETIFLWGIRTDSLDHGGSLWYAREKMKGHLKFLRNHEYRYTYGDGFILNDEYYGPKDSEL